MNTIQEIEQEQIEMLTGGKPLPDFAPGDTVRVMVKVVEGTRERVQAFEGVCIARKNAGLNSSFTVRKLSYGEGVERVFPLYSPRIEDIELVRRGRVRRAKLYYLRGRTGKAARIAERTTGRARLKPEEVATADEAFEIEQAEAAANAAETGEAEATEAKAEAKAAKAEKKAKAKADKKAEKKAESEAKKDDAVQAKKDDAGEG